MIKLQKGTDQNEFEQQKRDSSDRSREITIKEANSEHQRQLEKAQYKTQTFHQNTVLRWVMTTALVWLVVIVFALFYLLRKESPDSSIAIALISAGTTTAVIAPAFIVNAIFRRRRSKEELAEQMADIARAGTNASSEAAVN